MQPNVANKVQMIPHKLTVLTTASRLEVQPCTPGRSAIAASMVVYRILRTIPVAGVNWALELGRAHIEVQAKQPMQGEAAQVSVIHTFEYVER